MSEGFQGDKPRRDHYGEPDPYSKPNPLALGEPAFPKLVRVAGVIWIVFGCLLLVNGGISLLLSYAADPGKDLLPGQRMELAAYVLAVFGLAFLLVGWQSTQGTAKDTLGNGIGSIGIGLVNGAGGALIVLGALSRGVQLQALVGGFCFLAGLGLLVAGALALMGRDQYKAWRLAQKRRAEAGEF
jgi:hypothetical protein